MKKILAALIALAMIACMSIPAFAGQVTLEELGNQTIDVEATLVTREDVTVNVYSVNVEWEDMTFTYTTAQKTYTWDPENLEYDETVDPAKWNKASAAITVTNSSDLAVAVTASATNGFTVTGAGTLASAIGGGEEGANVAKTLTLTVTPPASIAASTDSVVTVTIAAPVTES